KADDEEKNKRLCTTQKEILVEFLEKHPELKSGKFSATFTNKISTSLWKEVAGLLNAVPLAPIKTHDQWRKCWTDMKRNTKQKASRIKKHQTGTGGGEETVEQLSLTQNRICDILGPTAVEGHQGIHESKAEFDFGGSEKVDATFNDCDSFAVSGDEDDNNDKENYAVSMIRRDRVEENAFPTESRNLTATANITPSVRIY
ncbi:hypothetical protein Bhyg_07932, partial [Pseudolycoriella hygida]